MLQQLKIWRKQRMAALDLEMDRIKVILNELEDAAITAERKEQIAPEKKTKAHRVKAAKDKTQAAATNTAGGAFASVWKEHNAAIGASDIDGGNITESLFGWLRQHGAQVRMFHAMASAVSYIAACGTLALLVKAQCHADRCHVIDCGYSGTCCCCQLGIPANAEKAIILILPLNVLFLPL